MHCQHALGLGHLVRSLALADGLAPHFDVVVLNGGRMPEATAIPSGVRVVNLPALGYDAAFGLVSHDPCLSVDEAKDARRRLVLQTLADERPAVLVVELYPFGRRKFAFEIEPLLDAARALGADRPLVVCSVRDILVNKRRDQAAHDERAVRAANERFDVILVHSDPTFARLEDSFHPATPLEVPVHHTGFVTPAPAASSSASARRSEVNARVLVSAGGGMVGESLFRAAVDAHEVVAERLGLITTVVGGPFLPERCWTWLRDRAAASPSLHVVRRVDDLLAELGRSALSVSQCGYNTTMDVLRAGTPALMVPYSENGEDEQRRRADRLASLGAVRTLPAEGLDGERLAGELCRLARFRPTPARLDVNGRETSARIVADLAGAR